ncbi:phenazine biosynthesis PhzF protein family [Schizosaccharomyces pombe]|uniref:Antisense-enhancing sequence 1 n=1 Tax=Schizosaccharomyces pombe (strain 972 / ATCC 24843) TaxID=284812 RepID=AES1_SCHPO|nr:RNA-mediated gene silencing enhancer protein [Schizosaccharomyces pombe]Q8NIL3.1 RecName: Full=Antisense-enhancing sequence 1; AltName: Full=AES factor 1 [Schizosaccharomyces pombe 972h-]CAD31747.1 enhancer of RNA-mediated gene silencing [Schizosaccharomyces pombe]|eukprot:NP_001018772.1 RNA-mediated gene silencing enhancer protein [Schizosaccharomyces pombe]
MTEHSFKQIDVFSNKGFRGNPVAVFFDADNLSQKEMQQIAKWTNLSETTFVQKPTIDKADYRLRIFTPECELSFAGHPTIGSCFAVVESGYCTPKNCKIIQECLAGLVELTIDGEKDEDTWISFKLPYYKILQTSETAISEVENALGIPLNYSSQVSPPVLIDDGPKWLVIQLPNATDVLNLVPKFQSLSQVCKNNDWIGVTVFGELGKDSFESRSFAPLIHVNEDPACGSGAGAVGVYIGSSQKTPTSLSFTISQGTKLSRQAISKVSVDVSSNKSIAVFVGGQAKTCISGKSFI